jgi:hypothetical protein
MGRFQRAIVTFPAVLAVAGLAITGAAPSVWAGARGAPASARGASASARGAPVPLRGELSGVACTAASSCLAVGEGGGPNLNNDLLSDQWNGSTWTVVPVAKPSGMQTGSLAAITCLAASDCTAVGDFSTSRFLAPLIERWNGTAWAVVPAPRPGKLATLGAVSCSGANSCAAVGCLINGNVGCVGSVAEQWNGTAWKLEPTPAGGLTLNGVSCTAPDSCMAVGFGNSGALAERWNGTAWSVVPIPNPPHSRLVEVNGLWCSAAGCEAVGDYANKLGGIVTLAEHWDGHAWSIQRTPNPPGALVGLYNVSCSADSACTAVGNYDDGKGHTLTTALRWNGTAWALQAPANPHTAVLVDGLFAVSCASAARCTAVGDNVFTHLGGTRALAEGWDGTTWAIEATPAAG